MSLANFLLTGRVCLTILGVSWVIFKFVYLGGVLLGTLLLAKKLSMLLPTSSRVLVISLIKLLSLLVLNLTFFAVLCTELDLVLLLVGTFLNLSIFPDIIILYMAAKSESKKEEVDESTERLFRAYRKNLLEFGIHMPKKLEEKFSEIRDEKNPGILSDLVLWESIGPAGIKAISDALRDSEYKHLRNIRLWKANSEDEGVRSICQYLRVTPCVITLEFLECDVTPLGCEFLGNYLNPNCNPSLVTLKLDHNAIGDLGIRNLARGLAMNSVLAHLSLTYCEITEEGARALMEILIFQSSSLQDLDLQGNSLKNPGVSLIFHAMQINQSLTQLNLADNQFGEEEIVLEKLSKMLASNKNLQTLDLRYNGFYDAGAETIYNMFLNSPEERSESSLSQLLLPQNKINPELLENIEKILSSNKSKGKKGKKGKKKGKK